MKKNVIALLLACATLSMSAYAQTNTFVPYVANVQNVIANASHTYKWGMNGEDGLVMEIKTSGSPNVAGSTIDFNVLDGFYDYQVFTKISCGDFLIDKVTYPDWEKDGFGGIFGYTGEMLSLSTDEEDAAKGEPLTFTFTTGEENYIGIAGFAGRGPLHEYYITWNTDGTIVVSEGTLTE